MDPLDFINQADPQAIESLYQQYRSNPDSVDSSWQLFFKGFDLATDSYDADSASPKTLKEFQVINLIHAYRVRGHFFTKTNPVRARRVYRPDLRLENFGLSSADLDSVFQAGTEVGIGPSTLSEIIDHLELTYCHAIGIEYMSIQHVERQAWVREHIELANRPRIGVEDRVQILKKLAQATLFEEFLQKKFVGQKRFSLEGGETLIAALDALIEEGTKQGVKEVFIGMAHRGRLSTLAHILGKPYEEIFCEFEGKAYDEEGQFDGDVKYHLGYSRTLEADTGEEVTISLAPNPSHLEAVGPVVQGLSRARIDALGGEELAVIPILIHGDAAISGQGVVYEVAQMAQLDGYRTGGTVHIVVNNQVGFTTNYLDGRSSIYCTDVGKVTQSLVFHVNADEAEAVVQVMRIALAYRQRWNQDVYIDLLGYRKYGHNEGDEPMFTQPQLYKAIAKHDNPFNLYADRLVADGSMTQKEVERVRDDLQSQMEEAFAKSRKREMASVVNFLGDLWESYGSADEKALMSNPKTAIAEKKLKSLAVAMSTLPEGKKFYRKVQRLMRDRLKMIEENRLDWALGELLAYATLLVEGHPVRISGQDVERGTFSHRHAVLKTEDSEEEVIPLNLLDKSQAKLTIFNSLLSEYAVSGFDYGYAFAMPNGLIIWEAQFGDFNNGAQILFDQFLSAAEDKWRTMNGITLLLPHGYEGMGSEHSSGRMERFLQLGSGDNFFVCNVTEPANYFHLLRRQVKFKFRKPLVVFTPKKLLRYPKAVSRLSDMAKGGFQKVLDDPRMTTASARELVDVVVMCSGKIYYDLIERLEVQSAPNIAFVRVEQLHPLPQSELDAVIQRYSGDLNCIWVQEEPQNMGAWSFMLQHYTSVALSVISRSLSASPASGSSTLHAKRQRAIIDEVFSYANG
ncbi:MAG: 2-oxoglutarate dehydrogenase E1 component [Crocinitomicaceae bacterium]|nr:2-oxoglutarate dehydrogenase E1 component [Crocinitomicaceae bacterium]